MALARLFGFGALGCLYGGRLMNLLVYTLLCYAALRSAKKCRPAFLAVMLLPMSLYMGASLSYDAVLLACYYLMLALLTCPEWDSRTAAAYTAACVFANAMPSAPGRNGKIRKLMGSVTESDAESRFSQLMYWVKLSQMLSTRPSLPYCFKA